MKLIKKHIEKDTSGYVTLVPEDSEDMWHMYNLLQKGDELKASTVRRVVSESMTGSTEKSTVHLTLTVVVEEIEFDVQVCKLRVNGRNLTENKFVKLGAYHTIDLELNRPFTLTKTEWDLIALERVQSATNVTNKAEIAAVVMQEGLANVCLMTENMTIVRQRIETSVPKKRKGYVSNYEKGMSKFFEQVYRGIMQHVNFDMVKVLIVASPGFVKDQFFQYLNAEASKRDDKTMLENKGKIVLVHCSSGNKHALQEVLKEPAIQNRLADTKYAMEVKSLERFYQILANDADRAYYGYEHVNRVAEMGGAIETLLVSEGLFRSSDIGERKKYVDLVERVREQGAKVNLFSTLHASGEQLSHLTGIAAILHFSVAEEEES